MSNLGKKYKKYKRLSEEEKEFIEKLYNEKMELRKIARVLGRHLRTIQYYLKKNSKNIESYMNTI